MDASPSCNSLQFQFGLTGIGTNLANRQWSIKVFEILSSTCLIIWLSNKFIQFYIQISQISCYSISLPPQGCTQYYTGTSNYFNSYNYAGGVQLANQNQHICFRLVKHSEFNLNWPKLKYLYSVSGESGAFARECLLRIKLT